MPQEPNDIQIIESVLQTGWILVTAGLSVGILILGAIIVQKWSNR